MLAAGAARARVPARRVYSYAIADARVLICAAPVVWPVGEITRTQGKQALYLVQDVADAVTAPPGWTLDAVAWRKHVDERLARWRQGPSHRPAVLQARWGVLKRGGNKKGGSGARRSVVDFSGVARLIWELPPRRRGDQAQADAARDRFWDEHAEVAIAAEGVAQPQFRVGASDEYHAATSMMPNGYMQSCAGRGAKAVESRPRP